ncbi:MAG: glycosyltransferase [Mariprofundaceae bacterium]|nr:glycosyltransferase [Mariprofundaceae bacterium]
MQVMIIAYVLPEPKSTGSGARMMELIRLFLAQGWSVHMASPAQATDYSEDLSVLGIKTSEIVVNHSSFDDFIAKMNPNIVLFDRFVMEEQFGWRVAKHCPQALRMLETIDLHCLREARHQQTKRTHAVALEPDKMDLYSDIAKREIAAVYRSDISLLISDYEIEVLDKYFHIAKDIVHLCPFMLQPLQSSMPSFSQRQHFISIGNFRHAPNWDAVLWLKQEIWPLIRAKLPKAELHVYGAYAPPKATALDNAKEGFFIKGRAEDAHEVMQQARINLAPLRFGAGIKTKLADGMLTGTPSVTTSVGAEGMTGGLAWGGSITDDAQDFADAAVVLYQDEAAWQQAQQRGTAILGELFEPSKNGRALLERMQQVLENLAEHRQNNFTGQMLNHHHHRSTEFMSRWIEAKNKSTD